MLINLTFTSLGCGRKLEDLEKMYTDMGRMCKFHTDKWSQPGIVFFPHQHDNEMMLNEMMLVIEDLL